MAITTSMIKELRDATSMGINDCKKALEQTGGDFDAAAKILREKGAAIATKRASKEANEGMIASIISSDARQGGLIEVNCETDFVTRNEAFQAFVEELRQRALDFETGKMAEGVKEDVEAIMASTGEKIMFRRNVTWTVEGTGAITSYIHMGGKVGVLVEVGCENAETVSKPVFQELSKDLTLHVAAAAPQYLTRDEVPAETVEEEKDIARKQLEGKPANIIDNILVGKINKFYSQICFIEQGFVKDDKISITDLLAQKGKELGDTLTVKRYVRYQLGGI
jgi:elongation factor Ts